MSKRKIKNSANQQMFNLNQVIIDDEKDQSQINEHTKDKKIKQENESLQYEIKQFMYAAGDDKQPSQETYEQTEQFLEQFITNICSKALERSRRLNPQSNTIAKEDLLYFIQSDDKKANRVCQVLKFEKNRKKLKQSNDTQQWAAKTFGKSEKKH